MKAFAFAMLEYAAPNNGQGKYIAYCACEIIDTMPGCCRALDVAFRMATTCIGMTT